MTAPVPIDGVVRGALLALSLVAPPGPVNVAQVDAGLSRGWPAGLGVGLGATVSIGVYAVLALAGATVLVRVPGLRTALWAAGTLVMAGYGLATLRAAAAEPRRAGPDGGAGGPFLLGLALGALNPMALVLVLALAAGLGTVDVRAFLVGFVGGMAAWNLALAAATEAGGQALRPETLHAVRLAAGAVLLGYAAYFAWSGLGPLLR